MDEISCLLSNDEWNTLRKSYVAYLSTDYISTRDGDSLSENTAKCYGSYINNIRKIVDERKYTTTFDTMLMQLYQNNPAGDEKSEFFSNMLLSMQQSETDPKQVKRLQDFFSGYKALLCFMEYAAAEEGLNIFDSDFESSFENDVIIEVEEEPSVKKTTIANKGKVIASVLDYRNLINKFILRLKTQDRYYPAFNLYFPIRIIQRIFSAQKDKSLRNWMVDDLNNRDLLDSTGTPHLFYSVDRMEIEPSGAVSVYTTDGSKFALFTRTSDGMLVKQHVCSWRDISLDHKVPLEAVLRTKNKDLHSLRELSDLFDNFRQSRAFEKRQGSNKKEIQLGKEFVESYKERLCSSSFRMGILTDLTNLKLKYELMDSIENTKKGKN